METTDALSQAESFIRHNQTGDARKILGEILREDTKNEEAWILSSQVSDKPEQVLYCLHRAIEINPTSSRARILLEQLEQTYLTDQPRKIEEETSQDGIAESIYIDENASSAIMDTTTGDIGALEPHIPQTDPSIDMGPDLSQASAVRENLFPSIVDSSVDTPPPIPEKVHEVTQTKVEKELPEKEINDKTGPADQLRGEVEVRKRPMRWLQRLFTIAGTVCLFAPWITRQNGYQSFKIYTGAEILWESFISSLGPDLVIAILAAIALPVLIFFRFRSGPTQRWGERATIALVPIAALPAIDLIASFLTGQTAIFSLQWGIWGTFIFYSLAGLSALIAARRLGRIGRKELYAVRSGRIFTWILSFGNILAILVTLAALVLLGKFSLIGVALPIIWLSFGAILSHFA